MFEFQVLHSAAELVGSDAALVAVRFGNGMGRALRTPIPVLATHATKVVMWTEHQQPQQKQQPQQQQKQRQLLQHQEAAAAAAEEEEEKYVE